MNGLGEQLRRISAWSPGSPARRIAVSLCMFFVWAAPLVAGGRHASKLNDGWQYLEAPDREYRSVAGRSTGWVSVTLPHTWNAFDAVDPIPGYRRSASWYRRTLPGKLKTPGRRILLAFEGANISTRVFVNGKEAGGHVGGYIGFEVDITPYLLERGENRLSVRVDNSYNPDIIPSQKSDFFVYGGITRDVWLKNVPAIAVERLFVRTPSVRKESATTEVTIRLWNSTTASASGTAIVELVNPAGKPVVRRETPYSVMPGSLDVKVGMPAIPSPELWSPEHPALYTARVTLSQGGRVTDEVEDRYGYRWFEFKEHGPFLLNGERLLLRGTHRHEDHAGLANAIPDSMHRNDMRMIKEMGANFVRLAHYPQDPEVYRACDELGLIVWDELPWCRGGIGGATWKSHVRRLLREQMEQNLNHPSIILQSLGNEIPYDLDFEGGDNIDSLRAFFGELGTIARSIDPTRPISVRKFYEAADLVDVFSPSIWMGWYSGSYGKYAPALAEARQKYSRMLHMEYGGDSHVGRHAENPVNGNGFIPPSAWDTGRAPLRVENLARSGDWGESYMVDLFDWHLRVSEQLDWFTGNAQWVFKDFGTPLRSENPIPYVNQKGLVDRAGKPKDAYYVFKSYWTSSPKFCYIISHSWTDRNGPPGVARQVRVYSNCSEVELLVNGVSQGRRTRNTDDFPGLGCRWDVQFAEGRNHLQAGGWEGDQRATTDTMSIRYSTTRPGEPKELTLESERRGDGTVLVTARAVDDRGRLCVDHQRRIYFSHEGDGSLLVHYGTPTRSGVIEMANGVAQIEFVPAPGGRAVIEARTHDLKGAYIIISETGAK